MRVVADKLREVGCSSFAADMILWWLAELRFAVYVVGKPIMSFSEELMMRFRLLGDPESFFFLAALVVSASLGVVI